MRVAVSGSHRTGKSTLVEALAAALPGFTRFEEPYRLLEEDGYAFADPPTSDDFEAQLERAVESILESAEDSLFDRCPADILAYLKVLDASGRAQDLGSEVERARAAMRQLDIVVLVPIETPDRIVVAESEDPELRERMDGELQSILLDDPWNFDVATVTVTGTLAERATQVLRALGGGSDA